MTAASAADAGRVDDKTRNEAATVFVTVTSQVALIPSHHAHTGEIFLLSLLLSINAC